MHPRRLGSVRAQHSSDAVAVVTQRRPGHHFPALTIHHQPLRHVIVRPLRQRPPLEALALRPGSLLDGRPHAPLKRHEIPALGDQPSPRVNDPNIETQGIRQRRRIEVRCAHGRRRQPPHDLGQLDRQQSIAGAGTRRQPRHDCRQHLAERHQMSAFGLRQSAQQRLDHRLEHPRDQPMQPVFAQVGKQPDRHHQGHAVVGLPRREAVLDVEGHAVQLEAAREVRVGRRRVTALDVGGGHEQALGIVALGLTPPTLEAACIGDPGGHARIVEVVEVVFADQQIAATQAVFPLPDLFDQRQVVSKELAACVEVAGHQAVTQHDLPGAPRIDAGVAHPTPLDQRQAKQRDALVRAHLAPAPAPGRLAVAALEEMRGRGFDPLRGNRGDTARVDPRRLHDLGRHQPAWGALAESRTGKRQEPAPMGADVLAAFVMLADVA